MVGSASVDGGKIIKNFVAHDWKLKNVNVKTSYIAAPACVCVCVCARVCPKNSKL